MKHSLIAVFSILLCIPAAHGEDFSRQFKKANPAVVVIHTKEQHERLTPKGVRKAKARSIGTGVIIDSSGLILTAAHVVGSAHEIQIQLQDERKRPASVVTSLSTGDIALLQMEDPPENLHYIEPGDSDAVEIGEQVFVIGTPYGLDHTLTVGHLSGRRVQEDTPYGDIEFLQTDAAINQGNSGGPLFSEDGKLIGIVSHIATQSGGNEGLGFAASSNMAKRLLIEDPPVWLGADFVMLTEEMAAALNAGQKYGMLVQKVAPDSMAAKLGIKPGYIPAQIAGAKVLLGGDIITSINGTRVEGSEKGMQQLVRGFNRVEIGDTLTINIVRRGQEVELSAKAE